MTRHPLLLAVCAAALAAPASILAQAPDAPPSPLPVRRVTLFTSGVAYTERAGDVDGDASVPLVFPTAQINDILKSLVLLDTNGKVQPATYAARDPISHTLQAFAVDVTQPMSMAELLNRLRGANVQVTAGGIVLAASTQTPVETLTGQIVGVESKPVQLKDGATTSVDILTVLGDGGLQSVRLDEVKSIKLLDPRLDSEFRQALGLLATGTDSQRRQVMLHFAGNGRRPVRVGYVTEAPLWKMSYRLMLGGAGQKPAAGKPYLQGWALVENTSDDDWRGVSLSLVSGRPISFIQDLYQPLYIPRPVVPPDVVASPYPQTHGEDLQNEKRRVATSGKPEGYAAAMGRAPVGGIGGGGFGQGGRAAGAEKATAGPPGAAETPPSTFAYDADNALIYTGRSVEAQASGANAGELFEYHITTPVTLPRQQAAMIPVVAQDIAADKVLIYNADTGPRFPLDAVRIHNTTALHLKGGPVTVFDGGTYAGDAKMEDIPPGDSRLVSYAVDLSVEGERQGPASRVVETTLMLKRGVLTVGQRETVETTYTLKSKDGRTRTVLVEQPFQAEYKLVSPAKATERTASLYRFAVNVPAGKPETLKVVTERPFSTTIGVLEGDLNTIVYQASRKDITPAMRAALEEVVRRRRTAQQLEAQAAQRDAEVKSAADDQERIRKNMEALDRTSALYKRYVAELDSQESHIETLRQEAAKLRQQAAQATADLRAYLDGLTVGE